MSSSPLISPFAEKFLLPGNKAPRATGWNGQLPYYLDLGQDLHWHLAFNLRNPSFIALLSELPAICSEQLPSVAAQRSAATNQPTWDLRNSEESRDDHYDGESEGEVNGGIDQQELLAYYVPAHHLTPEDHGIHLIKRGIAHTVADIHAYCPDQPVEVLTMAAAFLLLGHEYCHAWIEDLCCMIDFSAGDGVTPVQGRRYALAQRQWGGCILMEEALCDTAAWGWLHEFLNTPDSALVAFDPNKVTAAFFRWLRNSPPGYRDFLAIRTTPGASRGFLEGIRRLLIKVYGFADEHVPDLATLQAHHRPGFAIFGGPHAPVHLEH